MCRWTVREVLTQTSSHLRVERKAWGFGLALKPVVVRANCAGGDVPSAFPTGKWEMMLHGVWGGDREQDTFKENEKVEEGDEAKGAASPFPTGTPGECPLAGAVLLKSSLLSRGHSTHLSSRCPASRICPRWSGGVETVNWAWKWELACLTGVPGSQSEGYRGGQQSAPLHLGSRQWAQPHLWGVDGELRCRVWPCGEEGQTQSLLQAWAERAPQTPPKQGRQRPAPADEAGWARPHSGQGSPPGKVGIWSGEWGKDQEDQKRAPKWLFSGEPVFCQINKL